MEHSNVAAGFVSLKSKVPEVEFVGLAGSLVMEGAGVVAAVFAVDVAGASTVHVSDVASLVEVPEAVASTLKVCEPTASELYEAGLEQLAKAAESREQRKVAPDWVSLKEKDADVAVVGSEGEAVMVTEAHCDAANASLMK
jgi:hypothetical protein